MFAARQPRRSPRSENVQTCQHSNVQTTLPLNSFPCHTSENPPPKSNHCHTSKIAQNNPCSCHTSEPPRGMYLVKSESGRLSLAPFSCFRHVTKNPSPQPLQNQQLQTVTPATPLESAFTKTAECHVLFLPSFRPLCKEGLTTSLQSKGIRTLSENSRVYPKASLSGTRSLRAKPRRHSLPRLTSHLPAPTWSGSLSGSEASSSALGSFLLFSELSTFNCQPSTSSIVISLLRYLITSHVQLPHQPRHNHLPERSLGPAGVGNDSGPR